MLARVPLSIARAIPSTVSKGQLRYVRVQNNILALRITPTRRYYSTGKEEPKNTEQTEQTEKTESTEETQQQQQQQQKEEPKRSSGGSAGPIIAYAGITLGAVLLYTSGAAKSIVDYFNESLFGSVRQFVLTFRNNIYHLVGISTEEVPFLPPALPEGYGRKYTIVLDMDALALCTQSNGVWRIQKRAGLDFFLATLVRNYEIILYTKEYTQTNQAAIFKLDPQGAFFQHTSYRESGVKGPNMQFSDRIDLFRRDPARIIFLDSTPPTKAYNHSHAICIGAPQADRADTVLLDLTRILHTFAIRNGNDVRPLIHDLQGPDLNKRIQDILKGGVPGLPADQAKPAPAQTASKGWGIFGK